MDYACAPPGEKTRLKMTISNTLTVRSGRLLTTSTIRWSRLYMTAHSYAVTFHCILINTWLNQARTTLLITQDKRTRQHLVLRAMGGMGHVLVGLLVKQAEQACYGKTEKTWNNLLFDIFKKPVIHVTTCQPTEPLRGGHADEKLALVLTSVLSDPITCRQL